ncbi:two-component response regulator, GGDEF family [Sulfurimonas gotlandica GD1]|uniref:Two-component response regulator, GGDEF family n=1 Tax=Sulfurimonas gotlandica (strain DSM 19862 / JCM 16533 / GD1) TaxID=929558 RepID=B6BJW1_SULGG|nr:response regulator [Sulfurimonas gotlandica]EDZ62594.1 two-component system sensor histidine kinase [Sulfurimonas gotlandica GD1]EHP31362.1 two-component response regulator, GGDEF family [Sulfurimonas gotlandica GD1]
MEGQDLDPNAIEYSKYSIHIVEDSPLVITALLNVLEPKNYIINSSSNGKEALEAINNNKPDLIILDVEMPIMNGYETITKLKENKKTQNIPVIFLTSLTKPDVIKKIFNLGASDYISKPFVAEEMLARVEKEIKNIMLQTLLKEKMSKLAELLSVDALTKASNKMHMTSIIKTNLKKIRDGQIKSFSLMYIDVDDFNAFIRANGINATDATIKKIAMIIKRSIRDKDILAHWHGDKFMISFAQISKDELDDTAKAIRDKISKAPFGLNGHLTCSISIVEITSDENINTIIDKLQNSIKLSKETNKGSIVKIMDCDI